MSIAKIIIDKFGGVRPMARATGLPPTTIQGWMASGCIGGEKAVDAQATVLKAARRLGIDLSPADLFDPDDIALAPAPSPGKVGEISRPVSPDPGAGA